MRKNQKQKKELKWWDLETLTYYAAWFITYIMISIETFFIVSSMAITLVFQKVNFFIFFQFFDALFYQSVGMVSNNSEIPAYEKKFWNRSRAVHYILFSVHYSRYCNSFYFVVWNEYSTKCLHDVNYKVIIFLQLSDLVRSYFQYHWNWLLRILILKWYVIALIYSNILFHFCHISWLNGSKRIRRS